MKPFEGTTYEEWLEYHLAKGGTYEQIVKLWSEVEEKKTPGQRMMIINELKKKREE